MEEVFLYERNILPIRECISYLLYLIYSRSISGSDGDFYASGYIRYARRYTREISVESRECISLKIPHSIVFDTRHRDLHTPRYICEGSIHLISTEYSTSSSICACSHWSIVWSSDVWGVYWCLGIVV